MQNEHRESRVTDLTPVVAGALAIAVGVAVLVGWALDIAVLKSLAANLVSVKPNTAFGFIITGAALLSSSASRTTTDHRRALMAARTAQLCAVVFGLLGALTLAEYAFGWNAGIDTWVVSEPLGTVGTSHPGRMAPETALCFLLISFTQLQPEHFRLTKRRALVVALIGLLVTTVALASLVAQFSPALRTHGSWGFTTMSATTALVLAVVGISILLRTWRDVLGAGLSHFSRHLWRMMACVGALAVAFALYARAESEITRAHDLRYQSYLLADELRQSSDDLTRMARTYVMTGDSTFKQQYHAVLDIRMGKQRRPEGLWKIYWDLQPSGVAASDSRTQNAVALLELLRRAGISDAEFRKLALANAESDSLTVTELAAMRLSESTGPKGADDRARAHTLLFSDAYRAQKMQVMRPIDEFYALLDQRTLARVHVADDSALTFRFMFAAFGLLTLFAMWRTYVALCNTLGGTLDEVFAHIVRIGSGNFSEPIPVGPGQGRSVLGWLSETQIKLRDTDRERTQVAEGICRQNVLLDALINSPEDIVIFSLDRSYCYTAFNSKHRREMLDVWNVEIQVGINLLDCMSDARLREMARQSVDRALSGEAFVEVQHQPSAGITYEFAWNPIRQTNGDIVGVTAFIRDITSRRLAEQALRASEEQFRAMFELASIGMAQANPYTGRILRVNEKMATISGYSIDELLGMRFSDITHPDDRQRDWDLYQRAVRGETSAYQVDKRYVRKDGVVAWASVNVTLIRDDQGLVTRTTATIEDITERKRAEHAVREGEDRLDFALTMSKTGAWDLNLQDHTAFRSLEHDRIFGYETLLPEWTYETFLEHIVPEDRHEVHRRFSSAIAAHGDWSFECRVRRLDGELRWIWASGRHRTNHDGVPERMSGIVQDITERKQAAELLALQNRIATVFLTQSDDDMFNEVLTVVLESMHSPFGVFGYLNADGALVVPTMTQGIWDRCQVSNKTHVFPSALWGDSSWSQAIREKTAKRSNVLSTKTPEGHVAIRRHVSVPILFQSDVIGLLQVANKDTDYTDADVATLETVAELVAPLLSVRLQRERAREALQLLTAELERRVNERTAQLEAANMELDAFSYSVSHDLRAPLRAIDGFSRILMEDYAGSLDAEGRRVLGVVSSETTAWGNSLMTC